MGTAPLHNIGVFMLVCGLLMISYTIGASHGYQPPVTRYRYLPRSIGDLSDDPDALRALQNVDSPPQTD